MTRISFVGCAAPGLLAAAFALHVHGAQLDTTADAVLGQSTFTTNAIGASATTFYGPSALATDAISGRLFVSDFANHRILSWASSTAFTNGQAADLVLGQSNFAGNSAACSATGLSGPGGIAVDQFGNVYVADRGNHRVLTFKPPLASGMAATGFAGQETLTSCTANRGGPVAAGGMNSPGAVALDMYGKLYVADTANNRVLGFTAATALTPGLATPLNVYGQPTFDVNLPNVGGAASAYSLNSPHSVVVDRSGNLWTADSGNSRVVRRSAGPASFMSVLEDSASLVLGQADFTTTAPGALDASHFTVPQGIAIDASAAVYVADTFASRILRFAPPFSNGMAATTVFGQAGSFTNGAPATTADGLDHASGVAVDSSGNLLVADTINSRVLRFDLPIANVRPDLTYMSPLSVHRGAGPFVLTVAGTGYVAGSTITWNDSPRETQFISTNKLVAQIPPSDVASVGPVVVAVSTPAPGGGISALTHFFIDTRTPLDASADRLLGQPEFNGFAPDNPFVGEEQLGGISASSLDFSGDVVVDPVSERLFVTDGNNSRVLSWPNAASFANASAADVIIGQPNEYSRSCNTGGISAATLCIPVKPAMDAYGALYVPDANNNRVLQYLPPFTTGMAASRVFGQGSFTTRQCNNGAPPSPERLCNPRGAVVSDSSLFVGDSGNRRVLVYVNPYGDATADVVIGQATLLVGSASTASATTLGDNLMGLSLDREGRLIVADTQYNRVLRFSPPFANGMAADLVIGQPDFVSSASGLAADRLYSAVGTAIDRGGNLLVSDTVNNRVLRFAAPLSTAMAATGVIGQTDFVTGTGGTSRTKFTAPSGISLDPVGNLFVMDGFRARLLAFDRPFPTPLPKSDTGGNGKSDLVWRASDGGLSVWDMNSGTLANISYGVVGTEWQVVATGDFNGDGKADLFWRRNDGATYVWFMDGTRAASFLDTGVVPLDFTPVAVADFNGDGYADVMFRRTNGQNYMWLMVNGSITSQGFIGGTLPAEWTVQGTGDLDGDGKADIVWRNGTTHETWVWTMNGLAVLASARVSPDFDATWQLAGVADFDGDGKDDLQWRRNDGNNFVLLMNGLTTKDYIDQTDVGPEWVIQGFGDFNADGRADILWRHSTTGDVVIWLMQVNAPSASFSLGNPGPTWSIAAPRR